jgi:TIR domain
MRDGRAVQIFLSYRRGDVSGHAGRLTDALRQRLGAKSVFQDVTAIAPGQDFTAAIDHALDESDAVLAVIGQGWLTAVTPQGGPRLFEAEDYVRLELARALKRKARVVPVLVAGAALPAAADLPDELRGLVQRQAVVLHDETWHQDVEGLVRSLRGEPAVPTKSSRRWLVGVVAVALVAVGAAAWWWGPGTGKAPGTGEGPGSGGQAGSESSLGSCAPAEGKGWTAIAPNDDPTGEAKGPGGSLLFTVKYARWRAAGEGTWQVTLATSMKNTRPDAISQQAYFYVPLIVAQQEFARTCFAPSADVVDPEQIGDALVGFEVTCRPVGYIELVVESGDRIKVSKDLEPGDC